MFDATNVLLLISTTIILGYVGSLIFSKTKIPDIIWLLLFGLLVGPVLGIFNTEIFMEISPLLSALAIVMILFEAGLNMEFYQMIREFPRSILLAVLSVILSIIVVGLLSTVLFGFDLVRGMLLGAIIGGTSSPIVLSIVGKLKMKSEVKTLLELESILTDPLCIVMAVAFINIIVINLPTSTIAQSITSAFSIGAMIGLIAGAVWLFVLRAIQKIGFEYILTVAILLFLYVGTEFLTGSGAISALVFGLVLGNGKTFSRIMRFKTKYKIKRSLKKFHQEITFFVKAFFFVYIGLIVSINPMFIIYGAIITAILLVLRVFVIQISKVGMTLTKPELNMMRIMGPRGLAAAVLAGLPLTYGIPGSEVFLNISFIVILGTVLYTTIATKIFYKPEPEQKPKVK